MKLLKTNQTYRHLIFATLFSTFGDSIYYIALLTYASQFENAILAITLVSLSETLPYLLGVVTGGLADQSRNKNRKLIMMGASRGLLYGIVGILMGFQQSLLLLGGIITINFISDIIGKYASGLTIVFYPYIVKGEDLEEAQGLSGALQQTASIAAGFIGAFLIGIFSYQVMAWLNSLMFWAVMVMMLVLSPKLHQIEKESLTVTESQSLKAFFQDILSALKILKQQQLLFRALLLLAVANGFLSLLSPLISIYFSQYPHLIVGNFALMIALMQGIFAVGIIAGNLLGAKLAKNLSLMFICQLIFLSLTLISLSLMMQSIPFVYLSSIMATFLCGVASPKLSALLLKSIPVAQLGTVSGGVNTILMATAPMMTILFTTIITALGLKTGLSFFMVSSGLCLGIIKFLPQQVNVEKSTNMVK